MNDTMNETRKEIKKIIKDLQDGIKYLRAILEDNDIGFDIQAEEMVEELAYINGFARCEM